MKSKVFNIEEFLQQVKLIKREFGITRVKRVNDRSRRRIAILVTDEFLRYGGDIDEAFFLEADLYRLLRKTNLKCEPTPEEIRLRELPRRRHRKIKNLNPLKLASENFEPENRKPYSLTEAIVNILTGDEEDFDGVSADNIRRGTSQTFKHLPKDARLFTKQKGPSLY